MPAEIQKNIALDAADRDNNELIASKFINLYELEASQIKPLLDFAAAQGITLQNLENSEINALVEIIGAKSYNNSQLDAWASHLKHAKAGSGAHVALHEDQADDITACLEKGIPLPYVWGSDRDFDRIMGLHTVLPKAIAKSGTYVLPKVGIKECRTLDDYILPMLGKPGDYHLLTPIVRDNSHWELLKVKITDGVITQATLWDSTNNFWPFRSDRAALSQQIGFEVDIKPAGIQRNGHSCMDHVTGEIFREKGMLNPISTATSETEKRQAICDAIKEPEQTAVMTQDEIHDQLADSTNQAQQLMFDAALAIALNEEYSSSSTSDEQAMANAFAKTAVQFKFFKPAAVIEDTSDLMNNHNLDSPTR